MNGKLARLLYVTAVAVTPVSVAAKFMLGATGTTWIDPSLLLSIAALLALLPCWQDFLEDDLRLPVAGAALLFAIGLLSACSGMILRPPTSLYAVLREPLRLGLNLVWFVTSAWFVARRPRVVLAGSIIAVIFALAAGVYLDLVAFRLAPAPESVVTYTRAYLLRQTLWFDGFPVPRMGSLFFESPPFGLFMFSMFIVIHRLREPVWARRWSSIGTGCAVLGALLSLSDQVLLAGAVGLLAGLVRLRTTRPVFSWTVAGVAVLAVCTFELQSFAVKNTSSNTGIVSRINGGSVGERSFHLHNGLSLMGAYPAAVFLGIGPGRYGEYAAATGDFPETVNMQTSEMEVLVEWGVAGLGIWLVLLGTVAMRTAAISGIAGIGLLVGLIVADSFQANWKYEAAFLAMAALFLSPGATGEHAL